MSRAGREEVTSAERANCSPFPGSGKDAGAGASKSARHWDGRLRAGAGVTGGEEKQKEGAGPRPVLILSGAWGSRQPSPGK